VPELVEVESARALLEARTVGRTIKAVDAPDAWFLKRGTTAAGLRDALRGRTITAVRRRGKQIYVDTDGGEGPTFGLHLGMSGRVVVDGDEAGDPLIYASNRDVPAWRRFGLRFADGGAMWLRDPRRLGAVVLDPSESRLGPDATTLTLAQLREALRRGARAPIKAVLMDQSRVAGLGNLLVDEILWRAGIDPARLASTLDDDEQRALHRTIRSTVRLLLKRGGVHLGDHVEARTRGGRCPRDGAEMERRTIGGRTTYSCPAHQH
jgi:formamidopyrimidine-DNA glycosylase